MTLEKRTKGSSKSEEIMYWRKAQELNNIFIDVLNAKIKNCYVCEVINKKQLNEVINKAKYLLDLEIYQEEIDIINKEIDSLKENEEMYYLADW